jgi:hypothetical protein
MTTGQSAARRHSRATGPSGALGLPIRAASRPPERVLPQYQHGRACRTVEKHTGRKTVGQFELDHESAIRAKRVINQTRVRVWLTASGDPASPPSAIGAAVTAALIATAAWAGAGIVLVVCYLVSRVVLDRRRLAGWESDWALTGPRWTTRR